jgi:hypothetical protein
MTQKKKDDWWKDVEPIHKDEGDGQRMLWVYARELTPDVGWPGFCGASHEYLLVEVPDGDGPEYGVPVLRLTNGKAEVIGPGQFIQGTSS